VSATQDKALSELIEAPFPIRLHAATGKALERRGLAERRPNGYVCTDRGRKSFAYRERKAASEALEREFPPHLTDRLEKTMHWLQFTGRLKRPYSARPLIQSLLMGREPFDLGGPKDRERRVRGEVKAAIKIVDDFHVAYSTAVRTGGEVGVTIEAEKANPVRAQRWRKAQVEACAGDDGTVDLRAFRQRRGAA
jgi:hypothetical protein